MPVFGLDGRQAERSVDFEPGRQQIFRLLEAWREIEQENGPASSARRSRRGTLKDCSRSAAPQDEEFCVCNDGRGLSRSSSNTSPPLAFLIVIVYPTTGLCQVCAAWMRCGRGVPATLLRRSQRQTILRAETARVESARERRSTAGVTVAKRLSIESPRFSEGRLHVRHPCHTR
jgi:hypothetical protein